MTSNNFQSEFDVEVISDDIDEAQNQADAIKTALQSLGAGVTIGTTYCQAIFVELHNDDYISRVVLNTDDGLHVCAFSVRVFHQA